MFERKTRGGILLKLGIVLAVLIGVGIAAFSSLQKTARIKKVKRDTAVDAVTGSVVVNAQGGTSKELKVEASGKVIECSKIVEGEPFKEGDVLLQLDPTDLKRSIADYERNYIDAKKRGRANLTGGKPELLAKASDLSDEDRAKLFREVNPQRKLIAERLEQVRRLHALNNVSDEDLRNAERALENKDLELTFNALDEAKSEADFKFRMETLKIELDRMKIVAPADGEIVEVRIWKGALIGGGHVVGLFMSHDRVVNAKISEESFGRVRLGQKARVRLLTYGEQNFDAKVSKMLPKADDAQRFTVFLDVKVEDQALLRPNSTGEVTITVDARPNALMIPRVALFDSDKVCVVKDGRVEKRQVKIGYVNLTEVEILSGVADDEHVIVDRAQEFRTGDRVRVEIIP